VPGLSLFSEYLHNEKATTESFDEHGYFITGDRVTLLEHGFVKFGDRAKDMLKVGGENVAASEIEQVIALVPGVREAAVVAKKHPMLDEVPVVFIIPHAGVDGAPAELHDTVMAACRSALADFKVPHEIRFVDEMPRATLERWPKRNCASCWDEAGPIQVHAEVFSVIARSHRVPPLAGPMLNSATKQSSLVALDCFASLAMTLAGQQNPRNNMSYSNLYPIRLIPSLAVAALLSLPGIACAQTADTILINGKILTVDKDFSTEQALAIAHGQVLATGTSAAMKKLAGDKAKLIDLGGRTVIPGLTDGHIHGIRAALTFGNRSKLDRRAHAQGGAGEDRPGGENAKARLLDRGGRRLDRGAIRREAPTDRRRGGRHRTRPSGLHPASVRLAAADAKGDGGARHP